MIVAFNYIQGLKAANTCTTNKSC